MLSCGAFGLQEFMAIRDLSDLIFDSGHGTYLDQTDVVASVAGTVERVNKLVSVRALRTRFRMFHSAQSITYSPHSHVLTRQV